MPIEQVPAYKVGELVFPTIQEAQEKEITSLIFGDKPITDGEKDIIGTIVQHTDEIVAILTCQPAKKPKKPRSDKGKKRTPKTEVAP